jgi:hypothetical protein
VAFTIPHEADAFDAEQAEVDRGDLQIITDAPGLTGVVSGCAVSAQGSPDMTVAVASGVARVAGRSVTVAAGNVTITTADGTRPRLDLVVVNNAGTKSVTAGTAAAQPVFPSIPSDSVVLAAVLVPASDTTIASNQITDKRVFLAAPALENASWYDDDDVVVLDDCEDTTGWDATGEDSGPEVSAAFVSAGSNSVRAMLNFPNGSTVANLFVNLASAVSTNGAGWVLMDILYDEQVAFSGTTPFSKMSVKIGSSDNLGGTTSTLALSSVAEADDAVAEEWVTVRCPVGSVTSIKSVGLQRTSSSGSGSAEARIYIDNIRLASSTAVDKAFRSSSTATVVVPAGYSESVTQYPITPTSTKNIVDLRRSSAVVGGIGGMYNVREWGLDETGVSDVSADLQSIIASLSDGDTLVFPPSGVFLVNSQITVNTPQRLTLDGQGCSIIQSERREDRIFVFQEGSEGFTFRNFRVFGYRAIPKLGNENLTTTAGSPTVSGTTTLLDAQNEAVVLEAANPNIYHIYARDYTGRCRFDFTLSDSNQVASDVAVEIVTNDGTETIETTLYTVTGTPTVYTTYYTPRNLSERIRVQVRKATATANTITITGYTYYGHQSYNATYAFNHGVQVAVGPALIEDCLFEGVNGDGVTVANGDHVTVRRCMVRVNGRQGISMNIGTNLAIEDCELIGAARHAMDFEPETIPVEVNGLRIERVVGTWSLLSPFVATAFARVRNVWISDLTIESDGPLWTGGFTSGQVRNLTLRRTLRNDPTDQEDINAAVDMLFRDVLIDGVYTDVGMTFGDEESTTVDSVTLNTGYVDVRNVYMARNFRIGPINMFTPNSSVSGVFVDGADSEIDELYTIKPSVLATDTQYTGLNQAHLVRELPNTFKGSASSSPWYPRGQNNFATPQFNVAGLSGSSTRSNNLRGVGVTLGSGVTSKAVTFASKSVLNITSATTASSTGGTLTPATQYFYKAAGGSRLGGPLSPGLAEFSRTTTAGTGTAITLTLGATANFTSGLMLERVTLYRGTSTGVYTTRYDLVPDADFWGLGNDDANLPDSFKFAIKDFGTELGDAGGSWEYYGLTIPVAAQAGSFTPADESGYEPDTSYDVWVTTSFSNGGWWITNKTRAGFTVNWVTATADTNQTLSWLLVR